MSRQYQKLKFQVFAASTELQQNIFKFLVLPVLVSYLRLGRVAEEVEEVESAIEELRQKHQEEQAQLQLEGPRYEIAQLPLVDPLHLSYRMRNPVVIAVLVVVWHSGH